MPLDPNSGLPLDPTVLQQMQEQRLMQQMSGRGNMGGEQNASALAQGISSLFPSPAVQQARAAQSAMQGAVITQNDGESDLDFAIRQTKAQRDALAPVNPEASAQLGTQLLKLGQMQFEQNRLKASDQREQETFDAGAPARAEEKATGGLAYLIKPSPSSPDGYTAKSYDLTDPSQVQAFAADRQKDPSLQVMTAKQAGALFTSSNTAEMRAASALAVASQKVSQGMIPDEAVPGLAARAVFDKQIESRLSPQAKAQLQTAYDQAGISATDIAGAQTELKAVSAAAGQAGRRVGNVTLLENSLGAMGQQVEDSLKGVTRSDMRGINYLIAQGKSNFSDPGEARYAAAIQTFVNEYARLIAGGTGTSTEGARREAWETLNKYGGPAAIVAGIRQMGTTEAQIVHSAGDTTIELLARPDQYKALSKIQQKLGLGNALPSNADQAVTQPQPAPSAAPQQAPAAPKTLTYDPASGSFK